MEAAKLGMQETQELVDGLLGVVSVSSEALKDGKMDISDLPLLLKLVPLLSPAIKDVTSVPKELADMDAAEGAALVAHVMATLVIDDAKARLVIEKALKCAVSVGELVHAVKA